ncbi:sarcoplasmic reticulum histidine-rich calcium-binding protein-like [Stylophora pistillata]|uniref:Sarcoplasmic reticulum histidine-rich calcium-binding protein n=1 Tax=Stylophora pistillata TaxID=50429 RepID=A0A2B4S2I4_STYPI|nr:sarcoplasmic reticulum histidine-rich calcium-binding protein-like [Stylophora pistillata]PFX24111.1 Sarcoplasmic reticulum histidine-rich calcium-binding protein [Stylophora pistillata]
MKLLSVMGFLSLLMTIHVAIGDEEAVEEPMQEPKLSQESEAKSSANDARSEKVNAEPPTDSAENSSEEDKTYALGSLCNYCTYCKFCELCDKDCPCEKSKKKPNCHLCKYCKYCSLCSVCDTVCTPGGVVDVVSSAIYNSLPSFDKETKEKVDEDIKSARKWIKEYL